MGWQARHKGLSPAQAKAQLLALSEQNAPFAFVQRYPFRAVLIALAAGMLFSKSMFLLRWAGRTGWPIVSQFLMPRIGPASPMLDRIRARTYRRGLRR